MSASIDLTGADTFFFKADHQTFRVDLIAWVRWYLAYQPPEGADPYAHLDAIKAKLLAENGTRLSDGQTDAFLHELLKAHDDLKKKQLAERTSASSTASTPSD